MSELLNLLVVSSPAATARAVSTDHRSKFPSRYKSLLSAIKAGQDADKGQYSSLRSHWGENQMPLPPPPHIKQLSMQEYINIHYVHPSSAYPGRGPFNKG